MPAAGRDSPPTQDARLLLIPDALIPDAQGGYALHPALGFMAPRLARAAKLWAEAPLMAPIEWYALLLGTEQGASALLADAMGDAVPADARQCWLFSPFAGRLGRDSVHIMPDEALIWDAADAEWLAGLLQPLLSGDGFTLLVRDGCLLAVTSSPWDARPASFAQVSGHVLPNRHPQGSDGGRLMRLCAEMQMLLAANPSARRRAVGLPDVMGTWLWA
ncbi:MAG TPA: threonine synthase, partial [Mariprofundaceae bacterium]|nr:threonine synthase [Mariprofundaceae bacterium]